MNGVVALLVFLAAVVALPSVTGVVASLFGSVAGGRAEFGFDLAVLAVVLVAARRLSATDPLWSTMFLLVAVNRVRDVVKGHRDGRYGKREHA